MKFIYSLKVFWTVFGSILICIFYFSVLFKFVATTRAEKSFPFNKNTTYLAPFLTRSISATSNWFYCFMSKTFPLASHYKQYSLIRSLASFLSVLLIFVCDRFLLFVFCLYDLTSRFQPLHNLLPPLLSLSSLSLPVLRY